MNRIALTLLICAIASPLTLAARDVDVSAIDRLMTQTMTAWKIPGAAIAVVKDDQIIFLKGYGFKVDGGTERVTPDTNFQIGSVTKAFTTTAMAMLVDEKKMDWDDPVRKHLDYFRLADPCADAQVTLRDIVSHRTGLTRHDELWDDSPWSREEVIRRIGSVKLSKPLRTLYQYQNIMFIAAGEATGRAAKSSWDDLIRRRIFEPLGMTRSTTGGWADANHAAGHRYEWKKNAVLIQPAVDDENVGPAGSIKSNARDMAQWVRFHLNEGTIDGKKLISAEALNETKMPQTVIRVEEETKETNPETHLEAYGLGWIIQDYRGELLVSHSGALNGFRAQMALLPEHRAGFFIVTNLGRGRALTTLRSAVADLLLGKPARDWNAYYVALDRKSDEEDEAKKRELESKRHRDTKPSRDLSAYGGTYESQGYGTARVTNDGGRLVLHWSRLEVPLTHFHFDTFTAFDEEHDLDEQVTFALGPDGEVRSMTLFDEEFKHVIP